MRRLLVPVAAVLAALATAAAAETVSISLPADRAVLASGPGMEVTRKSCQMCHSVDYILMQPRGGEAQWRGVVTKMIKVFGAPISEADARVIVDYLAREYGPGR